MPSQNVPEQPEQADPKLIMTDAKLHIQCIKSVVVVAVELPDEATAAALHKNLCFQVDHTGQLSINMIGQPQRSN